MLAPTKKASSTEKQMNKSSSLPESTPGPKALKDKHDPNPGELYRAQLSELNTLIGEHLRARAVTDWAISFFQKDPDIDEIAQALSHEVDLALLAVNDYTSWDILKAGAFFDLTNYYWFPGFWRDDIDFLKDFYTNISVESSEITYRIPKEVAVAIKAVEDTRGKCEEHAFLAIYLLSIGHMIQNMPFGQLHRDIFYTGVGTAVPNHAKVILVKGLEFKDAIIASKKGTEEIDNDWIRKNPGTWGNNAWIVDGWKGKAIKLSDEPIPLDEKLNLTFVRDPKSGVTSEWDVTVDQMIERVKKTYSIE
jgi:hypothetical protein